MDRRAPLKDRLDRFARARRWTKYHTPKNLAMALVKEAAEVVELFQWLTPAQSRRPAGRLRARLADELADTYIYLTRLADVAGVDLDAAARAKMKRNERRFPVRRSRSRRRR